MTKHLDFESIWAACLKLQAEGKVPVNPSREQRADWAYGNTKIENHDVTWEMAWEAAGRPWETP